MTFEQRFSQLESILSAQGISLQDLGFRKGASQAMVEAVEKHIGQTLPVALRELLMHVDGQEEDGGILFPGGGCARMLSCEEIIKTWDWEKKHAAEEGAQDYFDRFQDKDRIRAVLHHEKRIVIAEDPGIALVALDFVPGPQGVAGQVITDDSECDFVVLADGFEQYFSAMIGLLVEGKLAIQYSDDFECHILTIAEGGDLVSAEEFIALRP